jgi:hypothetical protein
MWVIAWCQQYEEMQPTCNDVDEARVSAPAIATYREYKAV